MSTEAESVVGAGPVSIVPPKRPPKRLQLRWGEDVCEEIQAIADRTGRSFNEASEYLVRWAVERDKAETEILGEAKSVANAKAKPDNQ